MPKDTTRASVRADVEPAFNAAGLEVAARNTAIPAPRSNYRPEFDPDYALIARSLSGLAEATMAAAVTETRRQKVEDYREGQAQRVAATEELIADPSAVFKERSEEFIKGWNYQNGLAMGAQRAAEMDARYEANPDAYPLMSLLSQEFNGLLQEDLRGMDEAAKQGYLESMARAEPLIRGKLAKYNATLSAQATADDWMNATRHELATAAAANAKPQDLHTIKTAAMERASITGVPREVANKQLVELMTDIAIDTERLDVFDVFEMDSPDVDNPDSTVPGLANSAKWRGVIHDAKYKVATHLESKRTKKDQEAEWNGRKHIDSLVKAGKYEEARAQLDTYVHDGIFNAGLADSRKTDIDKAEAAALAWDRFNHLVDSGNSHLIPSTPDYTTKQEVEWYQRRAMEKLQAAEATGDPVKQAKAYDEVVREGAARGIEYPLFKGAMSATPSDPEAFLRGYAYFNELDIRDAPYAHKYIDENQLARFRMYEQALRSSMPQEEALQYVKQYGTKEAIDAGNRAISWDRRDLQEYVDDNVLADAKTDGWNMDAGNAYYAYSTVEAIAATMVRRSGGALTKEQAFADAAERFRNTHSTVQVPGSGEVIWVPNTEGAVTDADKEALSALSEDLTQKFANDLRNKDENGYFAQPDSRGRWTVYKATNRQPVIVNGGPVQFQSLKGLTAEHLKSQSMSAAESARLQAAAQDSRAYKQHVIESMQGGAPGYYSPGKLKPSAKADDKPKAKPADPLSNRNPNGLLGSGEKKRTRKR